MSDNPKRYWTNNDYLRAGFPLPAPTIPLAATRLAERERCATTSERMFPAAMMAKDIAAAIRETNDVG